MSMKGRDFTKNTKGHRGGAVRSRETVGEGKNKKLLSRRRCPFRLRENALTF